MFAGPSSDSSSIATIQDTTALQGCQPATRRAGRTARLGVDAVTCHSCHGRSNAHEDRRHASVVALEMFPLSAADMRRMLVL